MKKTLIISLLTLAAVLAACKGPAEPTQSPLVKSIGVSQDTTISIGSTIDFSPVFQEGYTPKANETYQWVVDGTRVASTLKYSHTFTNEGVATISFSANNDGGEMTISTKLTVIIANNFYVVNSGWFGHDPGSLTMFNVATREVTPWAFKTANAGLTLGTTSSYAQYWKDAIYIVSKQGNRLVSADSKTLKQKAVATEIGGDGRAFAGVTETEGVVTTSEGAFRVELATLKTIGNALPGTENLQCGAVTVADKYLFVITESNNLLVFDTQKNYAAVKTIPNVSVGFARTPNGTLWCGDGTTLVGIDPITLTTTTTALPQAAQLYSAWGSWNPSGLSASTTQNIVYIPAQASAWGGGREIYRYQVGNAASLNQPYITSTDDTDNMTGAANIAVDPATGNIAAYFCKAAWGDNDNRIVVFDAKTGKELIRKTFDGYFFPSMILFQ